MGNPFPVSLPAESRKAAASLRAFTSPRRVDKAIPRSVLARAQGFAIFSVFRIGFLLSARGGAGVVVARLPDGTWSPPTAIGLGGLGGGFNCGAEVTDFLIVLTSRRAVSTFMATGSLQLGGNLALAIGPLGRAAEAGGSVASNGKLAALLSYSKSMGLYGGISLEGTILVDRSDANAKAYGPGVTSRDILTGRIDPPHFAVGLVETLNRVTGRGSAFDNPYVFDDDDSFRDGYAGGSPRGRDGRYDSSSDSSEEEDSLNHDLYGPGRGPAGSRAHKRHMSMSDTPSYAPSYEPPRRAFSRRTNAAPRDSTWWWAESHDTPFHSAREVDDMDPLDRELQQPPGNPVRHTRSRTYDPLPRTRSGWGSRNDSLGSYNPFTPSRSNPYSFPDEDEEGPLSLRSHRTGSGVGVGDYESQLAPHRANSSYSTAQSHFHSGVTPVPSTTRSYSSYSTRPTSPIGMEGGGSNTAHTSTDPDGIIELPLSETKLVMAKFAYTPVSPTDLGFGRGDVIRVTKCSAKRDDWWSGECHGAIGWFPANRTIDL